MAYRKHPLNSRKYKISDSHSEEHKSHSTLPSNLEEPALPPVEPYSAEGKKNPPAFSFLTSLFGSNERGEKKGEPLITLLGHEIYLDDLLLIGLIFLLLTDKNEDQILIIILVYLLLDIF